MEELGAKGNPEMLLALTTKREAWRQGKGSRRAQGGKGGDKGRGKKGDKKGSAGGAGGKGRGPTTKDGAPLCTNCGEQGHYKDACPSERIEASKRKCFRCDKPAHLSSQCTSGLPFMAVEEEDAVTMCVESDDGPWEEVVKGNRYPHMAEHILTLEHDTTFQVFEDPDTELEGILNGLDSESDGPDALISSSDSGDEQQLPNVEEHDDAVWLDDIDEDLMKSSDPLSPCCLLACTSRGRNCVMAM